MILKKVIKLFNKSMIKFVNKCINELKNVKNSSDDVKKDFIRSFKVLLEGHYNLDIDTLLNTYDINCLLNELQLIFEYGKYLYEADNMKEE